MSGWDVQMKSDQMVQQNRLGWGQIEAQASGNSAQMLAQGGQHIGGMIQQQRQFDAHQQMQAAQMQQQAQQFMMDNEIERQSAASDIALRQQQMQESVYKLEAMKALDAAGMSEQQLRSMKLQNDAAQMQIDEAKKKQTTQDEDRVQMMHQTFLKNAGVEGLFAAGLDVNVDDSGRMSFSKFKTPEEQTARIEAFRKANSRVSNSSFNENLEDNRLGQHIARLVDTIGKMEEAGATPAEIKPFKNKLVALSSQYNSDAPSAPDTQPELPTAEQAVADTISAILNKPFKQESGMKPQSYRPQDVQGISRFVTANVAMLRASYERNQVAGRKQTVTDAEVMGKFLDIVQNPDDPKHAQAIQFLRKQGAIGGGGGQPANAQPAPAQAPPAASDLTNEPFLGPDAPPGMGEQLLHYIKQHGPSSEKVAAVFEKIRSVEAAKEKAKADLEARQEAIAKRREEVLAAEKEARDLVAEMAKSSASIAADLAEVIDDKALRDRLKNKSEADAEMARRAKTGAYHPGESPGMRRYREQEEAKLRKSRESK